jgi:hypothetical protein
VSAPTPREVLQLVGTDIGRVVWPTVWIDLWRAAASKHEHVVATDCRFVNEADAVRAMGGMVIKLTREGAGAPSGAGHASETEMTAIVPDVTIRNDATIAELHRAVAEAVVGFARRAA